MQNQLKAGTQNWLLYGVSIAILSHMKTWQVAANVVLGKLHHRNHNAAPCHDQRNYSALVLYLWVGGKNLPCNKSQGVIEQI